MKGEVCQVINLSIKNHSFPTSGMNWILSDQTFTGERGSEINRMLPACRVASTLLYQYIPNEVIEGTTYNDEEQRNRKKVSLSLSLSVCTPRLSSYSCVHRGNQS
jgi:hypothetical protein